MYDDRQTEIAIQLTSGGLCPDNYVAFLLLLLHYAAYIIIELHNKVLASSQLPALPKTCVGLQFRNAMHVHSIRYFPSECLLGIAEFPVQCQLHHTQLLSEDLPPPPEIPVQGHRLHHT